jgi:hypothetical protein
MKLLNDELIEKVCREWCGELWDDTAYEDHKRVWRSYARQAAQKFIEAMENQYDDHRKNNS